ncbi:hypothetical protein ES703_17438 [subsurface metagenome]
MKQADPKRMVETKRLLESKIREIQSQESLLLFLFVESQPPVVSEPMLDAIWRFMEWLKKKGYIIEDLRRREDR